MAGFICRSCCIGNLSYPIVALNVPLLYGLFTRGPIARYSNYHYIYLMKTTWDGKRHVDASHEYYITTII